MINNKSRTHKTIIQLVPALYLNDAVGNEVRAISKALDEAGIDNIIIAESVDEQLSRADGIFISGDNSLNAENEHNHCENLLNTENKHRHDVDSLSTENEHCHDVDSLSTERIFILDELLYSGNHWTIKHLIHILNRLTGYRLARRMLNNIIKSQYAKNISNSTPNNVILNDKASAASFTTYNSASSDIADITVIYHCASGSGLAKAFTRLKCRKIMRYHNVTPPGMLKPYNKAAARNCTRGLYDMRMLVKNVDKCIAVSSFNKQCLLEAGAKCPVDVVPIILDINKYKGILYNQSDNKPQPRDDSSYSGNHKPQPRDDSSYSGDYKPRSRDDSSYSGNHKPQLCDDSSYSGNHKPQPCDDNSYSGNHKPQPCDDNSYSDNTVSDVTGTVTISFVGRIAPNKKFEDIIRAYASYHDTYNANSRLLLVGGDAGYETYSDELHRLTDKLGVSDNVIFTGKADTRLILAYYRQTDVFLCMSEHEGFCVPIIEAFLMDVPVVAYSSCAIPETMGGAGVLIKKKDYNDYAAKIDELITDTTYRQSIIDGQRRRLCELDPTVVKKQFIEAIY